MTSAKSRERCNHALLLAALRWGVSSAPNVASVRQELCDSLGCVRRGGRLQQRAVLVRRRRRRRRCRCHAALRHLERHEQLRQAVAQPDQAARGSRCRRVSGARRSRRRLPIRSPAPVGPADLFSAVIALRATLLPDGDAGTDADHWLALHAHVFGAAHDVLFELVCPAPPMPAPICVEGNRFAVVSVSAWRRAGLQVERRRGGDQ